MTTQSLVLDDFPQPALARVLSVNGRAHWAAKRVARLAVVDRVTIMAIRSGLQRMWGFVKLTPIYVFPDHRHRDSDNLSTGVLKATIDVLVKGTWLEADDTAHLSLQPVQVRVEKDRRALILQFEVMDEHQ